ncbi:MAG: polysaccharide biosynthesis protein [Porphyromonadaceae bacterium]|nr:polysaccharide biosynthesis protein [Porphyromonadaceae bacterium]
MKKNIIKSLFSSDIFAHFVSLKYLPRWVVLLVDVIASLFSYVVSAIIATQIYFDAQNVINVDSPFLLPLFVFTITQIFFFWLFHTYSGILRYSGFVDAAKLLLAVFLNVFVFLLINYFGELIYDIRVYNYGTIVIYGVFAFFFLFIIRLIVKNTFDFINTGSRDFVPVMIYGTKTSGIAIAKMLKTNENMKYRLVGFVDSDKEATSKILMGVKVYEINEYNVTKTIAKKAKAIIVSPLKMTEINPKSDLDIFIDNGLSVLVVPPVSVLGDEVTNVKHIKSIQIEDLLERPQIHISTENISKVLKDKVVLITGAAGSIGSEIVRQALKFNPKLIIMLDQAESPMHDLMLRLKSIPTKTTITTFIGDVRNEERMEQLMSIYHPEIIFHAAAYKHVPLMEENPTESIQTNIKGTKIMADLAVKYDVERFVMVSTDKAVNPTNVMGASKRIAEIYVQSLNNHILKNGNTTTKFITTRFGNVLGSNGSVIPHFRRQIENMGPVTVTHPDIIRYFMTIPEACLLVLEAGTTGSGGEIFIFDMGEPVKILDLAKKMIRLAGYIPEVDIKISFTGLRPGEKLYEELLNQKEITKETHHPKIMIATVREYDYEDVSAQIDELIKFSGYGKNFLSVSQMKTIVPEFISNNSQYERLDVEKELN